MSLPIECLPDGSAAQVLTQFRAPLNTPASTQLKDLVESSDGMDIPAVRIWLEKRVAR